MTLNKEDAEKALRFCQSQLKDAQKHISWQCRHNVSDVENIHARQQDSLIQ